MTGAPPQPPPRPPLSPRRVFLIVLDGMGAGAAPDAAEYGDRGSATLRHVLDARPDLALPNLAALGLGECGDTGIARVEHPGAARGLALPASPGKDSTTGHWELCGIQLDRAFPTYPEGFPSDLLTALSAATGRGVLGNRPASGTAILDALGPEHVRTGSWIVYTSADSVFQVAAHIEVVPLDELYRACTIARELLAGPNAVSRVIARPFRGTPGAWVRTADRKDFSLAPPDGTLLDRLAERGVPITGVGKVDDLFAGRHIRSTHTPTNDDAYRLIDRGLASIDHGLLFANVIEFDQSWGHRNDVDGFARGLVELDAWIPQLRAATRADDLVILTADHGNDPTTQSTDHARECVPILAFGPRVRAVSLGRRRTFADIGQTVAEFLGVRALATGRSFLTDLWPA